MDIRLLKSVAHAGEKYRNTLEYLRESIQKRLSRGKNVIIIIHGDTGSGKSTASLSIASICDPIWLEDPAFAATTLTLFSAFEFIILEGYLLKKENEFYRGRFIVIEEAESSISGIAQAAAVQEFAKHIQVFREWQINLILNLPFSEDIKKIKNAVAHHDIWTIDINEYERVVKARWKRRIRVGEKVFFVNPNLLKRNIFDPSALGAKLKIPFADDKIWRAYHKEKHKFFTELNKKSYKRILRTTAVRGDLSVAIVRPHLRKIAEEFLDIEDLEKIEDVSEQKMLYETVKRKTRDPFEKAALMVFAKGSMTMREIHMRLAKYWSKEVKEKILNSNIFKKRKGKRNSIRISLSEEGKKYVKDLLQDLL